MDSFDDAAEYQLYWETNMFLQTQELESLSSYYDSSSPDGIASPLGSKNIVSERNRRKKLNDRLMALRAVVPTISKMDKASIIKDAVSYIQQLNKQQLEIKSEISDLKLYRLNNNCNNCNNSDDQDVPSRFTKPYKRVRVDNATGKQYVCCRSTTIDDLEMRVSYVGEKTMVVSFSCNKSEGNLVKLCELFEVLKLKVITANITAFAGRILMTVFIQATDDRDKDHVRIKIESMMASTRI